MTQRAPEWKLVIGLFTDRSAGEPAVAIDIDVRKADLVGPLTDAEFFNRVLFPTIRQIREHVRERE